MNFDNFTNVTNTQERDLEMSRVFPSLMRKVYIWMTMALAITGVVAYGAGNSPALIQFLYMGRGAMIVMALVEFGISLHALTNCLSQQQQYGSLSLLLSMDSH